MSGQQPISHPAFDDLSKAVTDRQLGNCSQEALEEHVEAARKSLAVLESHLRREAMLRPMTRAVEASLAEIYSRLVRGQELLDELESSLQACDWSRAHRLLAHLARLHQALDEHMAEVSRLERERPRFSDSPPVDELLHTCYAFLDNGLGPQAVIHRVDSLLAHCEGWLETLNQADPIGREAAVFEEGQEEASDALTRQLDALASLKESLDDPLMVLSCMEEIRESTDRLVDLHARLTRAADSPQQLSCVACGANYSAGERVCASCGARLPQPANLVAPSPNLDVTIGGTGSTPPPTPQHIARLLVVVQQVRDHEAAPDALDREIDHMRGKLEATQKRLRNLPDADRRTPEEQLAVLRSTRDALAAELACFGAALDELQAYVEEGDPMRLETGVEQLMRAQAGLTSLQARTEEVLREARG